jgi:hypothetical protein
MFHVEQWVQNTTAWDPFGFILPKNDIKMKKEPNHST